MENINFEVKSIKYAEKSGYVVLEVVFNNSSKVYTYVRKYYSDNSVIISGYKVYFNPATLACVNIEKFYDTKGIKKKSSVKGSKKISDSIKEVIEDKDIKPESKPEEKKEEYIPEDEVFHEKFETIKACVKKNIPVFLVGPAGSGKNFTLEQVAYDLGLDFYFTNSVQQEYKLTGFIDAGGVYHETEFYKAFVNGGLFFLDEIDASIPEVLVLINAAIANGYFEFPTGRVEANKKFRVVAAGNTVGSGADEQYTGRMTLDMATLDRFVVIDFDYCEKIEMHLAKGNKELVNFVHELRKEAELKGIRATFSYRCIITVTKLENILPMDEIIKIAVFKGLDKDTINTFHVHGVNKYVDAVKKIQMAA